MIKRIFILSLFLVGCSVSTDKAERSMTQEAISDFSFSGPNPMGCADQDSFSLEFRGTKNGQEVRGIICSGLFKGATIRYY